MNYSFLLVVLTVASVNLALVKSNRTPLTDDQLTNNGYNYTDLGFFSKDKPFTDFPLYADSDPETIGLEFLLYNNESPDEATLLQYNNESSVRFSGFKRDLNLKVIIHGYGDDKDTKWVTDMKSEFFKAEETNVIIVNWGAGAAYPDYKYAAANTRIVGKALEILMKQIETIFYPEDDYNFHIHCVGHSLGAHICSYGSDRYKILFDRITGLDPAKELFEGASHPVRIDIRDAKFVDVIHTDSDGWGMEQETGRVDFYVNGGSSQPGCSKTNINSHPNESCNHKRAYELFIETINPRCPFVAYKCDSWDKYKNGECLGCDSEKCISVLGYFAADFKVMGKFYTVSHEKSPFCAKVYQFEMTVSERQKWTQGVVSLTLRAGTNETEQYEFTSKETSIEAGDIIKGMIVSRHNIGKLEGNQLMFTKTPRWCLINCPSNDVIFDKVKIQYYDKPLIISSCVRYSTLPTGRTRIINLNREENKGDCHY